MDTLLNFLFVATIAGTGFVAGVVTSHLYWIKKDDQQFERYKSTVEDLNNCKRELASLQADLEYLETVK